MQATRLLSHCPAPLSFVEIVLAPESMLMTAVPNPPPELLKKASQLKCKRYVAFCDHVRQLLSFPLIPPHTIAQVHAAEYRDASGHVSVCQIQYSDRCFLMIFSDIRSASSGQQ